MPQRNRTPKNLNQPLRRDGQPSRRGENFRSSIVQKELRARVRHESCVANGKKGWQTTVARYGRLFASQVLARWRREHPTNLERQVISWLDEFQVTYTREVQIGDEGNFAFADFVLSDIGLIIEVDGERWHTRNNLHGEDRPKRDAQKARLFRRHGYALLRLSERSITTGKAKDRLDLAIHRRMFGRRR